MKLFDVYPINNIAIEKARGSYVWDDEGTQYLDMYGGHAVISIGHSHPHYIKKINGPIKQSWILFKLSSYSDTGRIGAKTW